MQATTYSTSRRLLLFSVLCLQTLAQLFGLIHAGDFVPVQLRAGFESTEMAPSVASNGDVSNGNGSHMNGIAAANGNGSAARPAVAPKSTHEDRWSGIERPYSQVCISNFTERPSQFLQQQYCLCHLCNSEANPRHMATYCAVSSSRPVCGQLIC